MKLYFYKTTKSWKNETQKYVFKVLKVKWSSSLKRLAFTNIDEWAHYELQYIVHNLNDYTKAHMPYIKRNLERGWNFLLVL